MDFSTLDYSALIALKKDIEKELKNRESAEKAKAKQKILELAKSYDLDLTDLSGKPATPRKPVAAKYRHPDDANQTWSGRGRKPAWVLMQLAAGKTLEDLQIK